jgi:S-adenosyl-L-methionine hydrolase (adenosine-forming)
MSFTQPSGVITLTTDFGLSQPFVGVMKGRIYSRFAAARIVDLTHGVLAHWPAEAGFWLARSFGYFSPGTVHVAVVDPGVGTQREIAIVTAAGHCFLAPDNGLLAPIVESVPDARCWALDASLLGSLGIHRPSATFHGRDIFAPLAALLAAGQITPAALGRPLASLVPSWVDPPVVGGDAISGVVMTVDHFGNLITNVEATWLAGWVEPHVYAGSQVLPLRRTYGDVMPGQALALVNSFGVVEIAVAERRAEEAMGLSRGAPVIVRDAVRRN